MWGTSGPMPPPPPASVPPAPKPGHGSPTASAGRSLGLGLPQVLMPGRLSTAPIGNQGTTPPRGAPLGRSRSASASTSPPPGSLAIDRRRPVPWALWGARRRRPSWTLALLLSAWEQAAVDGAARRLDRARCDRLSASPTLMEAVRMNARRPERIATPGCARSGPRSRFSGARPMVVEAALADLVGRQPRQTAEAAPENPPSSRRPDGPRDRDSTCAR